MSGPVKVSDEWVICVRDSSVPVEVAERVDDKSQMLMRALFKILILSKVACSWKCTCGRANSRDRLRK